ncbi:MAG: DUF2490 domain-containing protein [Candidatus Omnitrophica bacterium]|nr:DUF2490 domain-containing protein [Candidatus Omnitrophota bacterium]
MDKLVKAIFSVFIGVFISAIVFCGNVYSFDDGDYQYWNTENVSWKLGDYWKASLEQEFRFGDNASNLYYEHTDFGITWSGLTEWIDLGLNYRHIFEEKSSKWREENRPHLNATVKWKLFSIDFSNRGRLEYRNREKAEDFWRYRNKFTVKTPFKFTKFKIQPYVADEIFYDFDQETLNRNRFYAGITFKLLDNLKGNIFYLLERSENSSNKWVDYNVLGTKLKLAF